MSNFRAIDRATPYLLPPSVEEWLPEDHLARFVVDIIEQLDLSAMTDQYRGAGPAAYHPALLLALLVYGYATGTYSSRRIEAATYDSVAFRYLERAARRARNAVTELLGDAGYFSEANVSACVDASIEPLLASGRESHHLSLHERFGEPAALAEPADPTRWRTWRTGSRPEPGVRCMGCANRPWSRCSASSRR